MASINAQITGLKELVKRIGKSTELPKKIGAEIEIGAEKMRAGAINDAPSGVGNMIRSGIGKAEVSTTDWRIFSNASYSGFVEFGTKKKVKIPPGFESVASEIRNTDLGGTAEEALKSLTQWVKIKGIRFESAGTFKTGKKKGQNKQLSYEQTAAFVFHFIMLNGINAQPFFFKQLEKYQPEMIRSIENALEL